MREHDLEVHAASGVALNDPDPPDVPAPGVFSSLDFYLNYLAVLRPGFEPGVQMDIRPQRNA